MNNLEIHVLFTDVLPSPVSPVFQYLAPIQERHTHTSTRSEKHTQRERQRQTETGQGGKEHSLPPLPHGGDRITAMRSVVRI